MVRKAGPSIYVNIGWYIFAKIRIYCRARELHVSGSGEDPWPRPKRFYPTVARDPSYDQRFSSALFMFHVSRLWLRFCLGLCNAARAACAAASRNRSKTRATRPVRNATSTRNRSINGWHGTCIDKPRATVLCSTCNSNRSPRHRQSGTRVENARNVPGREQKQRRDDGNEIRAK